MGQVVEAFGTQLGRTVALKEVLPKGAGVEKRFAREVQITARLEHPAIDPALRRQGLRHRGPAVLRDAAY